MPEAAIISNEQHILIEKISRPQTGISREEATVTIYLYFNRLAKPVGELKSIIAAIDSKLLSRETVGECLQWMKEKGLAIETLDKNLNMHYIEITNDFESVLETLTGISNLSNDLKQAYDRGTRKICVNPKGVVGSIRENYIEMLDIIQHAQKTVNYAILSTDPYCDTVRVLKDAADKGVNVRILVASEKIARAYKKKGSVEVLWRKEFENYRNIQIRVFEDDTVTELCSSVQVDNILRLDIYDSKRVRSLDGYLLEIRNDWNENINLFRWYTEKFDKAWENAYDSEQNRIIKKVMTPFLGAIVIVLACMILYFKCRMDSALAQGLIDEILLLIIGAAGEYILRTVWPKIKSLVATVWKVLKQNY